MELDERIKRSAAGLFLALTLLVSACFAEEEQKYQTIRFVDREVMADIGTSHLKATTNIISALYSDMLMPALRKVIDGLGGVSPEVRIASPAVTPDMALGVSADLYYSPPKNITSVLESTAILSWSFSKTDLNAYNSILKNGYPREMVVPLGAVKLETKTTRFVRSFAFRVVLGLDLLWREVWRSAVASADLADLALEIADDKKEFLGAAKATHIGTIRLTDIPGVSSTLTRVMAEKLGAASVDSFTRAVSQRFLERILSKLSIDVMVSQTTRDRYADIALDVTAIDRIGNPVSLELVDKTIRFTTEGEEHLLKMRLPPNCPPLRTITLRAVDGLLHYRESGASALSFASLYTRGRTSSAWISEGLDKYYPAFHTAKAEVGTEGITVPSDPLVFIPFHGIVIDGSPSVGVSGARVEVIADDDSFRQVTFTGADGRFSRDFYTVSPKGGTPPYKIYITVAGQRVKYLQELINDRDGYKLSLNKSPDDYVSVSGVVLDVMKEPVPGAEVHLTSDIDTFMVSNEDGKYNFANFPKSPAVTISAFKAGYYFPPVVKKPGTYQKDINVDIFGVAQPDRLEKVRGIMKISFLSTGKSVPRVFKIERDTGAECIIGPGADRTISIAVTDYSERLTLRATGYSIDPSVILAEFPGQALAVEKEYVVTVTPLMSETISLAADKTNLELGGAGFADIRKEEYLRFTATVKDKTGVPIIGVPVRFDIVGNEGGAGIRFSERWIDPGCGAAMTDEDGRAIVTAAAYAIPGAVTIIATVLDRYLESGREWDKRSSNAVNISIGQNTRTILDMKPICSIEAYPYKGEVPDAAIPTIDPGGEIRFDLASSVGNIVPSTLYISGALVGYRLIFSRNGAQWQEERYDIVPPENTIMAFTDTGDYRVAFQVMERYGKKEIWSSSAMTSFRVIRLEPPVVQLSIPRVAAVGDKVEYAVSVKAQSPLKGVWVYFADGSEPYAIGPDKIRQHLSWRENGMHTFTKEGAYVVTAAAMDQKGSQSESARTIDIRRESALR